MILIDLVAKHKSGKLRCPATALITIYGQGDLAHFYKLWFPLCKDIPSCALIGQAVSEEIFENACLSHIL